MKIVQKEISLSLSLSKIQCLLHYYTCQPVNIYQGNYAPSRRTFRSVTLCIISLKVHLLTVGVESYCYI
jgi:hypothetical protein